MEENIHFYCINLKHRLDRWNTFSNQEAIRQIKAKYPFEKFEAIAGSTIDIKNDSRISLRTKRNIKEGSRRDHEDLNTAGGVGCYLSHTELWKKVAEGKEPYAIIFEDDTKLPDDFLQVFEVCLKDQNLLPEAPDVWTFSYGWDFYYKTRNKKRPQDVITNHRGPWVFNSCPGGLNGYFITKEGAKKLLADAFPIDMHVDLYICLCSELKKIVCVSHEDLILRLLVESEKSDIQLPSDCLICDIPTNYRSRGIIAVNLPILGLAVAAMVLLSYVGSKRGRK
jgi:GR25 family glycosyltransferase involved in LPS biosynthesis